MMKHITCAVAMLLVKTAFSQTYTIVSAESGKVLDVTGASTSDGAIIQQWDSLNSPNQQWQLIGLGNGYNEILNVNSGKVLDVTGVSTADGATIQQWDWLGGTNQQWQIVPQGSSYSAIVNLNSGKVLDVTGVSDSNGAGIQQWDWLNGLNQQWQIRPSSPGYQATAQTNIYYSPTYNLVYTDASVDPDYTTQYYYGGSIVTSLMDNGNLADVNTASASGYTVVGTSTTASPGHYYEAVSDSYLITQYTYQEAVPNCGAFCGGGYFYDPFDFMGVLENPDYTDIPVFTTTVWAPPVIAVVAAVGQSIHLGTNGASTQVPGNRSVFKLQVKQFIPPAWIRGAGYPSDYCTDSAGNHQTPYYIGDNRTFDPYSASYRAASWDTVSAQTGSAITQTSAPGMPPIGTPNPAFDAGTTRRYGGDALASNGYTLQEDTVMHDCHFTDYVLKESSANMHASTTGGGGSVSTNFWGSAQNATTSYPSLTPSIDWNITININATNPVSPTYTVAYTHDCYPAHEAYIGSQRAYGYRPPKNDSTTIGLCLAGVNQQQGTTQPAAVN